ncbi:hypothetical protein [Legionella yabuuchiae]|uniref:hypothetical protein n=1 Tax=Legionella yabuuchiae TaxID=376727 RepID=UPI001056D012|nr:hypothetical protein [Legionella yabuuchiae]
MTIFLILAQKIALAQLKERKNQSVAADYSWPNRFFSSFGLGRDERISDAKREILDDLGLMIKGFAPRDNDEENLTALLDLISKSKGHAKAISDRGGFVNEGATGPALEALTQLLNFMHKKLHEHGLTDIECTKEPYGIFCFYAARYFTTKSVDDLKKVNVASFMDNPHVSSAPKISSAKDKLLDEALTNCKAMIAPMDASEDSLSIKLCVKSAIQNLLAANKELCDELGTDLGLSVNVTLFSSLRIGPKFKPSLGRLNDFMNKALEAIETPALYDQELNFSFIPNLDRATSMSP